MKTFFLAVAALYIWTSLGHSQPLAPQIPLVNAVLSSDGSSLCMAVSGTAQAGAQLISADCVSGAPAQQFGIASDGSVHFGSINGALCVMGYARPNGGRNFSPGTPVVLVACNTAPTGLYKVDVSLWSRSGLLEVHDTDTSGYCISTAGTAPGQALVLNFYQNNAPSQAWSATIAKRWVSKNLNPTGLFNSQGFLVDNAGQPITALGGGLVALSGPTTAAPIGSAYAAGTTQTKIGNTALTVTGNGGKIVAQGGGNIVAQGGGNIVPQGAGNLQILDTAGNALTDALVNAAGTSIVAQGGGNIVAQGGGNIVAQGGGNIVAQGGGNYQTLSVGGGFVYGPSNTAVLQATASAVTQALLAVQSSAYKAPGPAVPAAPTAAFQVTSVAADPSPWVPGSVHTISWQGTGTPVNGQIVYVYLQPNAGAAITLCANIPVTAGRCSAYAPTTPGTGTLDVQDNISHKNIYAGFQTQIAAAAQPFTVGALVYIDSQAGYSGTPLSWAAASPHVIQWSGSGAPTAQETVSLWLAQGSNMVRLASGIPAANYRYNLPANSARAGTTGVFILKDDLTNKQVTGPTIQVK